jgi:hypothetical protein
MNFLSGTTAESLILSGFVWFRQPFNAPAPKAEAQQKQLLYPTISMRPLFSLLLYTGQLQSCEYANLPASILDPS